MLSGIPRLVAREKSVRFFGRRKSSMVEFTAVVECGPRASCLLASRPFVPPTLAKFPMDLVVVNFEVHSRLAMKPLCGVTQKQVLAGMEETGS